MDRVFQMMLSLKNLVQNTVLGVFEEEQEVSVGGTK